MNVLSLVEVFIKQQKLIDLEEITDFHKVSTFIKTSEFIPEDVLPLRNIENILFHE
jgi:hypothetical protein